MLIGPLLSMTYQINSPSSKGGHSSALVPAGYHSVQKPLHTILDDDTKHGAGSSSSGPRAVNDVIVVPSRPQAKWSLSDFQLLYRLGAGNYGQVYMAAVAGSNFLVALKRITLKSLAEGNIANQLRREVEIAFHVRHKNILRTYGYFYDQNEIFLILEACSGGMLYSHLMAQKKFPVHTAARFVAQLSEALLYLHRHHILHRDIKPENILIDHRGDIKLSDFGWSVHDPNDRRQTSCGTPEYFPPEIVNHKAYNHTADLWCVGILCYELLHGKTPFHSQDRKEIYSNIQKLKYEMPYDIPPDAQDLIRKLLVQDGHMRMSLLDVLHHPFIKTNYYDRKGISPPTNKRPRVEDRQ